MQGYHPGEQTAEHKFGGVASSHSRRSICDCAQLCLRTRGQLRELIIRVVSILQQLVHRDARLQVLNFCVEQIILEHDEPNM